MKLGRYLVSPAKPCGHGRMKLTVQEPGYSVRKEPEVDYTPDCVGGYKQWRSAMHYCAGLEI